MKVLYGIRWRQILPLALLVSVDCTTYPKVFRHKEWHRSPDPFDVSSLSSTAYPIVAWEDVERLRVGMTEREAEEALGERLQYYHHPINAIMFSMTPDGQEVEVAVKRSAAGIIEDISYKAR